MCGNNNGLCGCLNNNWWWIIILILLFCNCGGNWGGGGCDNNNNCGCCKTQTGHPSGGPFLRQDSSRSRSFFRDSILP